MDAAETIQVIEQCLAGDKRAIERFVSTRPATFTVTFSPAPLITLSP